MLAAINIDSICSENGLLGVVEIVGWILFAFKIVIPLLIIGYGILDFGKAVVAEKEDEIKNKTKRLVFRLIAGIAIFLLPNIVLWIFKTFVPDYEQESSEFTTCETCFLHPGKC